MTHEEIAILAASMKFGSAKLDDRVERRAARAELRARKAEQARRLAAKKARREAALVYGPGRVMEEEVPAEAFATIPDSTDPRGSVEEEVPDTIREARPEMVAPLPLPKQRARGKQSRKLSKVRARLELLRAPKKRRKNNDRPEMWGDSIHCPPEQWPELAALGNAIREMLGLAPIYPSDPDYALAKNDDPSLKFARQTSSDRRADGRTSRVSHD